MNDPRVFLSYTHHPEGRSDAFLELATRLRSDGVNLCFDRFDPDPEAGWPAWMLTELARADLILLGCSPAYARRFEGDVDALGGRGVRWEGRIILNLAYEEANLGRFVPIVIDGDDPGLVVPPVFRNGDHFGFDHQYTELLAHIGHGSRAPPQDSGPPVFPRLEPISREVAVVGGPRATELARDLGADVPVEADHPAASSARVVVVADDSPIDRLESAPDRSVVRIDAFELREEEARKRIKATVARHRRRHQRHWWLVSGRDLLGGGALALAWPILCARLFHGGDVSRAALGAAAGLMASGAFLLAGITGSLNPGYPVLALDRVSLGQAWRYLRRSVGLARASADPEEQRRVVAGLLILLTGLWTLFFWGSQGLGNRESSLVWAEYALVLGLGTVSWLSALKGQRAWLGSVSALVVASYLPRIFAQWGALAEPEDLVVILSVPPDLTAPATWVATTPSALPFSLLASSGVVFLFLWMTTRAPTAAWLRRGGLAGVAVLALLMVLPG